MIQEKIIEVKPYKSIEKTLGILFDLENQSLKDKGFVDFIKKYFANNIYKNEVDFIKFVHSFVFENMKYADDIYDETLISPRIQIHIMQGDCDDFALFSKTILRMFNITSKYILLAKEQNNFSHIALIIPKYNIFFDATNKIFNNNIDAKYLYYKIIG